MRNKLLIIGIDSFTGKHLSKYLEYSDFDIFGTSLFFEDKNILKCDISNKEDIKKVILEVKPNYIINLAAISFVAHENSMDFYKINCLGAINILDVVLELNLDLEKIILISSAAVYGNQDKNILDENMNLNPQNHYALSKFAMENLAKTYFDKLPIFIFRPFNYTGLNQEKHFLIPKIVSHFKEKKVFIELGNIDVKREFNDIGFVCEAYKRALETKTKSKIINIASSRTISIKKVINIMNNLCGYEIKIKIDEKFIRKNDVKSLSGSSKKLFKYLGKIKQKSFKNTLKSMLKGN